MRDGVITGRRPTFVVVGAAKSGTTALHEYLKQHPDIFMTRVKEPNYFAFAGATPHFLGPDDERLPCRATPDRLKVAKYLGSVSDRAAYLRLFAGAPGHRAAGESSVSYMYFPRAAERLAATYPDIRLVAVLRHPADRAYSKFIQFLRDGCEPAEDFEAALAAEDGRVARNWSPTWFYRRRGLYHAQLKPFYERFDRSQIRVFLHDDLVSDPLRVLRETFRFLGVDDRFTPDTSRRHNESEAPRRQPRAEWIDHVAASPGIGGTLERIMPARGVDLLQRGVRHLNSRYEPWTPPPFQPALRARLVESFREDIEALADLIGRDLSSWLHA